MGKSFPFIPHTHNPPSMTTLDRPLWPVRVPPSSLETTDFGLNTSIKGVLLIRCDLKLLLLLLSRFSRVRLCANPPGSPVPGILQARTLEWVAISFSSAWMHAKSLSCVRLYATLWTAARQAPLYTGFSRQEGWSGLPFPSPVTSSNLL